MGNHGLTREQLVKLHNRQGLVAGVFTSSMRETGTGTAGETKRDIGKLNDVIVAKVDGCRQPIAIHKSAVGAAQIT